MKLVTKTKLPILPVLVLRLKPSSNGFQAFCPHAYRLLNLFALLCEPLARFYENLGMIPQKVDQ